MTEPNPSPEVSPGGYVHTQEEPSTVWTIRHDLGHHPNVTAIDGPTGYDLTGSVAYPEPGVVTLTFGSPRSGMAYLS